MQQNINSHSGIIISATHTSAGKSSFSIGLMRLLKRKSFDVQPFKVGPDYIDPGHHTIACGRPSYNLDSWMCSPNYIKVLFDEVMHPGRTAIVEGVMGLFDGAFAKKEKGTTGEIAKLLNLPVILIVDGSTSARSVAALVKGFIEFDPGINFLGVIANRVNHPRHAKLIDDAITHYTSIRFLGYIPNDPELAIPDRHLGLTQGLEQTDELYERWADHIEKHVDLKFISRHLKKRKQKSATTLSPHPLRWRKAPKEPFFSVGIARDKSFQFLYQDTLDLIRHFGGEIRFFSPINDSHLPSGIDWLYFPGGYPELKLKELSQNKTLKSEIKRFGESGKVIIAECGGMMYLGKSIISEKGKPHPMVGLFNFSTSLKNKTMTLGYRRLKLSDSSKEIKSAILMGHEFHYSTLVNNREKPIMIQKFPGKRPDIHDGYRRKNCIATYTHIYWGNSKAWLKYILQLTALQSDINLKTRKG